MSVCMSIMKFVLINFHLCRLWANWREGSGYREARSPLVGLHYQCIALIHESHPKDVLVRWGIERTPLVYKSSSVLPLGYGLLVCH